MLDFEPLALDSLLRVDFATSLSLNAELDIGWAVAFLSFAVRTFMFDLVRHHVRLIAGNRLMLFGHVDGRCLSKMLTILLVPGIVAETGMLPCLGEVCCLFAVTPQVILPESLELVHGQFDRGRIANQLALVVNHAVVRITIIVRIERGIISAVRHVVLAGERLTLVLKVDLLRNIFNHMIHHALIELVDVLRLWVA